MRKTPALVAAFMITALVGILMLVVGGSALLGQKTPVVSAVSDAVQASSGEATAQIVQLQARIAEYRAREQQWQQRLDQAQAQTSRVSAELQQYQKLVSALQQMGVITIDNNGQVLVSRGGFERGHHDE